MILEAKRLVNKLEKTVRILRPEWMDAVVVAPAPVVPVVAEKVVEKKKVVVGRSGIPMKSNGKSKKK